MGKPTRNSQLNSISYKDISIAVMGAAGSGKSTFINLLSGSKLPVSSSLEPSKNVGVADYSDAHGRLVKLIDTPGLDVKSGDDIWKEIMATYPPVKRRKVVDGVVYLHRVSNARPNITKHSYMFKNMCGDTTLKHVVVVTNMWSELPDDEAREIPHDGGIGLNGRPQVFRHDDTDESARRILHALIKDHPPLSADLDNDAHDADCVRGCFGGVFYST